MGSLIPFTNSLMTSYKIVSKEDIFGGVFPSGTPIQNTEPERKDPRSYQVTTGQNVIIRPRSEVPNLTPFEVLNFVTKSTDLIQIAENLLLNQISGRKWDIVTEDPEDKADYKKEIKIAKDFFKHPDKERSYSRWIRKAMKNITRYDDFTIYKRRDRKGRLYGLNIVDGSTIKVITDSNGNKPIPPEKAYQQIIYGSVRGSWTTEELIYAPMSEELLGNYGASPVERILLATMKYLSKQQFDYSFYKEGAFPDGDLYALKPNDQSQWSADDIIKFQSHWQEEMSSFKNRQSLKFVPDGQLHRTKEHHWDVTQEEWFGRLVATSIGIDPNTFAKQINRAVADAEDRKQTELGLKPYIKHIEDILTDILQTDLGFEMLAFKILDEKIEDQKATVDKNTKYVMAGIYNRNEIRKSEGREPVPGGDEYTVQVGNALIPLKDVGKMVTATPETNNGELETRDITQDSNHRAVTETDKGKGKFFTKDDLKKKEEQKTDEKKLESPKVKKALGHYKNFLVKRFKENRPLTGYINNDIPEDVLKTIGNQLYDISSLEDIVNIFKADKFPRKKFDPEKLKRTISKHFKEIKGKFVEYFEDHYKKGDLAAVTNFDFFKGVELVTDLTKEIEGLNYIGRQDAIDILTKEVPDLKLDLHYSEHEAAEKAKQYVDKLVTGVNQATINFVQQTVSDAIRNEKSWEWIQQQLMDNNYYAFSEKRAEVIAKTEEARALNDGALAVWDESGLVEKVQVTDGDGCETCAAVDGTIVDIEWAIQNSLEHPNCVREFYPIITTKSSENTDQNDESLDE